MTTLETTPSRCLIIFLRFAQSDSLTGLILGRGMIGLGVSACLMAAFKAYVVWFSIGPLSRINGFQMALKCHRC